MVQRATNSTHVQSNPSDSASSQNDCESSQDPKLRRSKRARKSRDFYCKNHLEGKVIVTEVVVQCGLEQPGRNFSRTEEDEKRTAEDIKGCEVYEKHLLPAGWDYKPNRATKGRHMNESSIFLAPGTTLATAENGVTKFYGYHEIWKKWISDEDFRKMYEDTNSDVESNASVSTSNTAIAENEECVDVSVAKTRPVDSSHSEETEIETDSELVDDQGECCTPTNQAKRGFSTTDVSEKIAKKLQTEKGSTSTCRFQAETASARLQDPPVVPPVVSPTATAGNLQGDPVPSNNEIRTLSDYQQDGNPTTLRLAVPNGNAQNPAELNVHDEIIELRKQLEEAEDLVRVQRFEIEDLKNENNRLRKEKANEKAAASKWKDRCEQLNAEMNQIREN